MIKRDLKNIITQILSLWIIWLIMRLFLTKAFNEIDLFTVQSLYSLLCITIVIPINIKYLIPRFFTKKKYLFYFLSSVLVILSVLIVVYLEIFPWGKWYQDYTSIKVAEYRNEVLKAPTKWLPKLAPIIIAFLGSSLIEILKYANKKETEVAEAEKEKLTTELKFLKSQVNPHFLFNALNNIYSLSVTKSEDTSESIMQLSEILRYMVYDSRENKVPLKDEVNYIENFIQLMKLKDSRGMDVTVELNIDSSSILVAPLLFIPFIENGFKHSKIECLKTSYISIKLTAENDLITFSVVNSIPDNNFTKDEVGGIGILNTKKRLALLYPNKHKLVINESDTEYEVLLTIETS